MPTVRSSLETQTPHARASVPTAGTAPLRVSTLEIAGGIVLAPLSGITDVPFRRLVRSFGTELVYSEMVASGELVKGDVESHLRAAGDGGFHAVQIAGRDPAAMRSAATRLAGAGAELIDINMGCPAKKVVGGQSGSALMRDLDLAARIIAATIEGADGVPVTVKMRLGWSFDTLNAPELARTAEALGAHLVTVHGRTRDQFYEGRADWRAIARVADAVSIPVVANGDLTSERQIAAMRAQSRASGLMIGRGSCGRPWLPALLAGRISLRELGVVSFAGLVLRHYDAMLSHYGVEAGVRHARKHLGWYLDHLSRIGAGMAAQERCAILRESEPSVVSARLRDALGEFSIADLEHRLQPTDIAA